nr:MAG TPA: hypothetical protein [Caudoviricetes sp.]
MVWCVLLCNLSLRVAVPTPVTLNSYAVMYLYSPLLNPERVGQPLPVVSLNCF